MILNNDKKNMGDYQTPSKFTDVVMDIIKDKGREPDVILEPTVGQGSFLKSASDVYQDVRLVGVDINSTYIEETREILPEDWTELYNESIFDFDYNEHFDKKDEVLIIGNPPWITNSETSVHDTPNLPVKSNIKGLRGIDAMMGDSNFDIAEYIILDLLQGFKDVDYQLAMLCKVSVAYNIIEEMHRTEYPASEVEMYSFSAKEVFNVHTDACMLYIRKERGAEDWANICTVYDVKDPEEPVRVAGYKGGKFYTTLDDTIADIDGYCQFEWRQGVKHDAAKVVVLKIEGDKLVNGYKEEVDIEPDLVFPLLKSSEINKYNKDYDINKVEVVTQTEVGQDTTYIKDQYPKTWEYLNKYEWDFEKRGSSIYKNAPKFAMFGIGDYVFKPYKVAISGFYKKPVFVTVHEEKTVVFDDTCYFIGFDTYVEAKITELIMNSEVVQLFLNSVANKESKRPYTKKVLQRIDVVKALEHITNDEILSMDVDSELTTEDVENYRNKLLGNEEVQLNLL